MSETLSRVRGIVGILTGRPIGSIAPESSFVDDLGMDDLAMMEFGFELEAAFTIDLKDEDAENFKTVADVVKHVDGARVNGADA